MEVRKWAWEKCSSAPSTVQRLNYALCRNRNNNKSWVCFQNHMIYSENEGKVPEKFKKK